jgi:hypothetical protein
MISSQNWSRPEMIATGIETRISRLESIVEQIGDAVLSTTETIERLAHNRGSRKTSTAARISDFCFM